MLRTPDNVVHYHSVVDSTAPWCRTLVASGIFKGELTHPLHVAPTCLFCIYKNYLLTQPRSWRRAC
jgi:hypothetical protein